MNVIETKNLTKYYGGVKGIKDLNLIVEKGDFFGFIGPNGAGKSTCIRTLLGLIYPTGGKASVLGHDIITGHNEILRSIGYLPSEINFYNNMKVKDVIRYSADLQGKKCDEEAAMLCERLDLDTEKRADVLSLGNRKKAGIVCALQHRPELLILDEPTSGLDPLMQREFFKILREYNEAGTTVFLSSHILSEVQAHCRTAAFIKDGSIIISDKVEKLEETGAKKVVIRDSVSDKLICELKRQSRAEKGNTEGIVTDLKSDETGTSFLYTGEMPALLRLLAEEGPGDISITEPTMEEIFMNYYGS